MIFLLTQYLAQAPDITNDATIGQIIVQPTATATPSVTATPTSTSSSVETTSPTATPLATVTPIPKPTIPPTKRYRQNALTIYGYGPAEAEVSLKGFGVSEKVTSDSSGLFMFNEIYSFTYTYPELCVQAVDQEKRSTQPSCIPALPNDSLIPLEVGPILLSPTISISGNKIKEGGEALMSGKTIPNTKVNIFISKKDGSQSKLSLIKEVQAFSLPIVDTKSNDKGEYEISLPTGESADYKIFASAKYGEDLTNKSNTLSFSVLSQVKTLFQKIIDFILQNKMVIVALLEALVFTILFLMALKSTTKRKKGYTEGDFLKFNNNLEY